ncbi:amidohydrolase family protein [Kangiella sp. HZ709]|uniref:amidohydrolase family protein n=1 Tax=Kangiella sp. HZ709 TaxID=2666328 RepID=UPI0012AF04EF|nr:amidohydrolase family protein [Kangiella sp. HZ709]MRX26800.1 amidohydrolase family protein [Kangiella sp. HZ709]
MKLSKFLLAGLVAATSFTVSAESILIKNAKIHTLGSQGTLQQSDVFINNGKIISVGKKLTNSADRVIDATDKVVTPGIFAVANSLGLAEIDALNQTVDSVTNDEMSGASFNLDEAFNPNSTLIPHNRVNGVTRTLVSPAYSSVHLVYGQGSIMSLNGNYNPLIKSAVAIFGSYGESGSGRVGGSRATALKELQTLLDEAREYADNYEAIFAGEYRELGFSIDDLKAMQDVLNRNTPLVMSVNRASDIMTLLRFAKKNSIRLVLKGAAEGWMVAKEIAAANVPVLIDPLDNIPRSFEALGQRIENSSLMNKAGVELMFLGPGFQNTHNAHTVRHSAGVAVSYGMPYEAALKAFTATPAKVFGSDTSYGKIMSGYDAELVVWDGDPLEVTTSAVSVIIDGELVNMATKSKRLRDRYKDISTDKNTAYRK